MFEYAKHGHTNMALYSNRRVCFVIYSNSTVIKLDELSFQRLCYSVFVWKHDCINSTQDKISRDHKK